VGSSWADVGWTITGILSSPDVGAGVFFMVPFALSIILPTALIPYVAGRIVGRVMHIAVGRFYKYAT
jgi:hypothetical protein